MTNEEINEVAAAVSKLLEPRFNHSQALAAEANSIARGTAIQMAIMFDKFDGLERRVAALEPKKANGHG